MLWGSLSTLLMINGSFDALALDMLERRVCCNRHRGVQHQRWCDADSRQTWVAGQHDGGIFRTLRSACGYGYRLSLQQREC